MELQRHFVFFRYSHFCLNHLIIRDFPQHFKQTWWIWSSSDISDSRRNPACLQIVSETFVGTSLNARNFIKYDCYAGPSLQFINRKSDLKAMSLRVHPIEEAKLSTIFGSGRHLPSNFIFPSAHPWLVSRDGCGGIDKYDRLANILLSVTLKDHKATKILVISTLHWHWLTDDGYFDNCNPSETLIKQPLLLHL